MSRNSTAVLHHCIRVVLWDHYSIHIYIHLSATILSPYYSISICSLPLFETICWARWTFALTNCGCSYTIFPAPTKIVYYLLKTGLGINFVNLKLLIVFFLLLFFFIIFFLFEEAALIALCFGART